MNRRAAAADSQQDRGGYIRCPTSRPMLWWECCIQHGDLHLGLVRLLSNPVIESPVIVIADGRANRPLVLNGFGALFSSRLFGEYNLTDRLMIEVPSRAVVTDDVELPTYWFVSSSEDVRVEGAATRFEALFMGIAPVDAVAGYLDGVAHDEITDWDFFKNDVENVVYTRNEGTTDPGALGAEGFWVASVSGSGEQTLD